MKPRILSYVVIFVALLATACTEDKKAPSQNVIRLKGDPIVFLKGTRKNTTEGIPFSVVTQGDGKWSFHITGFVQEEQIDYQKSLEQQQPENLGNTKKYKDAVVTYEMSAVPNGDGEYVLSNNKSQGLAFHFKKNGDKLLLSDMSFENTKLHKANIDISIQHYSTRKEKDAFNVLVYVTDKNEGRNHLVAYNFIKYDGGKSILEKTLDSIYEFSYGPGVRMAWEQSKPLKLSICDTGIPTVNKWAKNSVQNWEDPLKGRLELQVSKEAVCPPFSDLNSLNMYHIDGWIGVLGREATQAFVVPTPNYYKDQIIDADIFYLKSDVEEAFHLSGDTTFQWSEDYLSTYSYKLRSIYEAAVIHETGHTLGLGHKMKGARSIMSYDKTVTTIQSYDIDAVQALYPKLP